MVLFEIFAAIALFGMLFVTTCKLIGNIVLLVWYILCFFYYLIKTIILALIALYQWMKPVVEGLEDTVMSWRLKLDQSMTPENLGLEEGKWYHTPYYSYKVDMEDDGEPEMIDVTPRVRRIR